MQGRQLCPKLVKELHVMQKTRPFPAHTSWDLTSAPFLPASPGSQTRPDRGLREITAATAAAAAAAAAVAVPTTAPDPMRTTSFSERAGSTKIPSTSPGFILANEAGVSSPRLEWNPTCYSIGRKQLHGSSAQLTLFRHEFLAPALAFWIMLHLQAQRTC